MRPIDADALISEIKKDTEKAIEQDDRVGSFWLGYIAGLVIKQPTAQPSTSDLISRQAAIDLLKQMRKDGDMVPWEGKNVFARIRMLPSLHLEERTEKRMETHACDCISRQMLLEYIHGEPVGRLLCDKYNLDGLIEQLPSAEPEPPEECERCMMEHTDEMEKLEAELAMAQPKRGRWISADAIFGGVPFYCSECGENTWDTVMGKPRWNFCPNCGADMRGEQNDKCRQV